MEPVNINSAQAGNHELEPFEDPESRATLISPLSVLVNRAQKDLERSQVTGSKILLDENFDHDGVFIVKEELDSSKYGAVFLIENIEDPSIKDKQFVLKLTRAIRSRLFSDSESQANYSTEELQNANFIKREAEVLAWLNMTFDSSISKFKFPRVRGHCFHAVPGSSERKEDRVCSVVLTDHIAGQSLKDFISNQELTEAGAYQILVAFEYMLEAYKYLMERGIVIRDVYGKNGSNLHFAYDEDTGKLKAIPIDFGNVSLFGSHWNHIANPHFIDAYWENQSFSDAQLEAQSLLLDSFKAALPSNSNNLVTQVIDSSIQLGKFQIADGNFNFSIFINKIKDLRTAAARFIQGDHIQAETLNETISHAKSQMRLRAEKNPAPF